MIAESFSGPVALALMARYPSRIRCAVLCATFAVSPFRSLTRLAQFMPAFLFGMSPLHPAMLRRFCLNGESDGGLIAQAISVVRKVPAVTMRQRIGTLARVDVRPSLAQVTAPVLYLQASQDRIVNARLSRDLIGALPRATVRTINGPHLLLQTRPRECADVIAKFIAECPRHPTTIDR